MLKAGGTVDLGKLLGDRLGNKWFLDCWGLTILLQSRLYPLGHASFRIPTLVPLNGGVTLRCIIHWHSLVT